LRSGFACGLQIVVTSLTKNSLRFLTLYFPTPTFLAKTRIHY
jgi:hypothetical protein